jgi:hypothetical protein
MVCIHEPAYDGRQNPRPSSTLPTKVANKGPLRRQATAPKDFQHYSHFNAAVRRKQPRFSQGSFPGPILIAEIERIRPISEVLHFQLRAGKTNSHKFSRQIIAARRPR